MLESLVLRNFRGFSNHTVQFRPLSVIVGRNNAGKSTIVEALRLVSIVTARFRGFSYRPPPQWLDEPKFMLGASPDVRGLELDNPSVFYEYGEPPAIVEARFTSGESVRIFIGPEGKIHAVILDKEMAPIRTRGRAASVELPRVAILPQPGPVAREETLLTREYVLSSLDSPLAPTHFRNQLRFLDEHFQDFCRAAEDSWPGFRVQSLDATVQHGEPIYLHVRNEEFVGEISRMGHGLQMWLQTIWFIARSRGARTLILDEPDVYMHPDLQRRLIRFVRSQAPQVLITTHSVEMISEVAPESIAVIERKRSQSRFADSLPAVQAVLSGVGSAHNIHLTRLWSAKRFILVEGDDLKLLRHLADTLVPDSEMSLEAIPNMAIGGWGGWNWAVGSSMTLKNAAGEELIVYCLLDRDFYSDEVLEQRYKEAAARDLQLHIWEYQELENYLVVPAAIARLISKRAGVPIQRSSVAEAVDMAAARMRESLEDDIATQLQQTERGLVFKSAKARARQRINVRLEKLPLHALVSGKELLAGVSEWAQVAHGVSFGVAALARELRASEIPNEMARVLRAIQEGMRFEEP
jgi:energy-coupling factor transporter ATP-binding protein EcfA2